MLPRRGSFRHLPPKRRITGFLIINQYRMRYLLANGQYLRIRDARIEDAGPLLDMFRQAVQESDFLMTTPSEALHLTLEQEREFIAAYQQNPNQLFLVGDIEGTLAGTLSVTQAKSKKQLHVGEFGIVVLRKYWNMGIARRMMHVMFQWLEPHPVLRYVHLSVMANNDKAIHLYRNFGFQEEGRKTGVVRQSDHEFQDVILMGKWVSAREKPASKNL
jgi:RimJ/RimL family protein N-acetyltransferase